jgi:hypothetical protein
VLLLGWDLLSQLKAQILLPPGNYLCCLLLQEKVDPTVWTDGMIVGQNDYRVSQNGLPNSNKTQKSLTVSTSKTVFPQA